MLLVILGAGASYDSIPPQKLAGQGAYNLRWWPPLANDLFVDRENSFGDVMQSLPECLPLIIRLRRAVDGGRPVEEAMRELQDVDGKTDLGQTQLTALRFYLQEGLWQASYEWPKLAHGATNLVDLVDRVEKWRIRLGERVIYVTFNYDLLLESAFAPRRFRSVESYVESEDTQVFKLHGSVNWGRRIDRLEGEPIYLGRRQAVIDLAPKLMDRITDGFVLLQDFREQRAASEAWLLYPALALPMTGKGSFECPSGHVAALQASLPEVSGALVVGWRAQEEHFTGMLSAVPEGIPLDFVSPEPEVGGRLVEVLAHPEIRYPDPTFSEYLAKDGRLEALLADTHPGTGS
jgi:hypothetical protein